MLQFQDGSQGQYGRTKHAYPPGTQNPKLYVDYYDKMLRSELAFASDEYVYGRYLETKTIPSMNNTTITIQRMDAVPGAGLSFNPMTGAAADLVDPAKNGAILDMNTVEAKNPIVLNRMAFKGELYLWGLWIQVNEIQDITDMYNILEESVKALARAIAETKDTFTRNFIMINSSKVYANSKDLDTLTVTDTLTFDDILTQCFKLQRNTTPRRSTDAKDADWAKYRDGDATAMTEHPTPIKGFKSDEGRYKVLISFEGYNQLINQPVFKEYFIAGKSLASNVNPSMVNAVNYNSNGEADAFFNFRLVKSPNTWRGINAGSVFYDTLIILPEGTFANLAIAGQDGVSFYMFKNFQGSVQDPLGRAGTNGAKWMHGVVKITNYTAAVTLGYASTDYSA